MSNISFQLLLSRKWFLWYFWYLIHSKSIYSTLEHALGVQHSFICCPGQGHFHTWRLSFWFRSAISYVCVEVFCIFGLYLSFSYQFLFPAKDSFHWYQPHSLCQYHIYCNSFPTSGLLISFTLIDPLRLILQEEIQTVVIFGNWQASVSKNYGFYHYKTLRIPKVSYIS